ncbi:beta-galactosidase [Quadrisphaera setariae]|nr:beta-galactosidase [Quadrisphaera setariae]
MRLDVELRDRRILVGGTPQVLRAGEVHYFRLARDGWRRRLELLLEAGGDTVATYVPWGVHELADGTLDLTGRTRPELDLGAFLDLAAELGLLVFARPGPFQMAELRHEGLPGRIGRDHRDLVPVGWDAAPAPTPDLDVAAPRFLDLTRPWYAAVGEVLRPRLAPNGGPVVAVQLDNEVGMLSWVSNTPVLTEHAVAELRERVVAAPDRRPAAAYPAPDAPLEEWLAAVRSPSPELAPDLRVDLAELHRDRAARYLASLADLAREHGFGDVPLLVNVHGTAADSAAPLPIGISQLQRSWQGAVGGVAGMTAGSDHYVGSLSAAGAAEMHLAHAFLAATLGPDQPLTVLEHECGTGDYGGDLGAHVDPEAVDLKTRLLLAQGARLFNWYLFAGGANWSDPRPGEAQQRIGITGERHGAAAPVTPEGERGPAFASTAASMRAVADLERWAAVWEPEHDALAVGYLPSAFATEHVHPADEAGRALRADLEQHRFGGPRGILPRVLLAEGYRFGAVDLEDHDDDEDGRWPRVVVVGAGRVLDGGVQERLVEHVRAGGGLLLVGDLPELDLRGRPCTALADALGLRRTGEVRSGPRMPCDVRPAGGTTGWAEVTSSRVSALAPPSAPGAEVLAVEATSGKPCAVAVPLGEGSAVVVAADAPLPSGWYRSLVERLGAAPGLHVEGAAPGLVVATTATPEGERFLHLMATSGHPQRVRVSERDASGALMPLLGGRPVELAGRSGTILRLEPVQPDYGTGHRHQTLRGNE